MRARDPGWRRASSQAKEAHSRKREERRAQRFFVKQSCPPRPPRLRGALYFFVSRATVARRSGSAESQLSTHFSLCVASSSRIRAATGARRADLTCRTPLGHSAASQSYRLYQLEHRDPADRLLIASAIELACPLVTYDERILRFATEYGRQYRFTAES